MKKINRRATRGTINLANVPTLARDTSDLCQKLHSVARILVKNHEMMIQQHIIFSCHSWHVQLSEARNLSIYVLSAIYMIIQQSFHGNHRCDVCATSIYSNHQSNIIRNIESVLFLLNLNIHFLA